MQQQIITREIKQTVPFSFDEIYEDLLQKFEEQGYDAPYHGSNTAQIMTAMAYLVSMLNVNTSTNINETILTLATKRDNVLMDARMLGYEISHGTSYIYELEIEYSEAGTYTIPKFTPFESKGKKYYFFENDIITEVQQDEVPKTIKIKVKEGELKTPQSNPELETTIGYIVENSKDIVQYYVDIPLQNVEENGIEVFCTYLDENGILFEDQPQNRSTRFLIDKDSTLVNEYVRLDNIDTKMPRLYFKLSGVGKGLRWGTKVKVNALVTSGTDGKMLDVPTFDLPGTIKSYEVVSEGSKEESLTSIKRNAPLFHNSANRAVVKSDYISICVRQSQVKEVEVWGGDDEYPKARGHVWFSFIPETVQKTFNSIDAYNNKYLLQDAESTVNWFLEEEEIKSSQVDINGELTNPGVWDVLEEYKIPTLIYHNRHPVYMDFSYELDIVKYNIQNSKANINQDFFEVLRDYFDVSSNEDIDTVYERRNNMETFTREYFHTNLIKRLDEHLTDVTGFNIKLSLKLMLTSKNIILENEFGVYNYGIYIALGIPYEKYFTEEGAIIPDVLPQIDTKNFIGTSDLRVDFTSDIQDSSKDVCIFDIYLGVNKVGEYLVHNTYRKDIEVRLYFGNSGDSQDVPDNIGDIQRTSVLKESDFDEVKYLNLSYCNNNFSTLKNTVPRLREVQFTPQVQCDGCS